MNVFIPKIRPDNRYLVKSFEIFIKYLEVMKKGLRVHSSFLFQKLKKRKKLF